MKFLQFFILIALLSLTFGCSKKVKPDSEDTVPQATTSDADLIVEADEQKALMVDETQPANPDVIIAQEPENLIKEEAPPVEPKSMVREQVSLAGEIGDYKVEKGETLMMVAFKIYGDYGMWKEIARMNPQAKKGLNKGMTLKFKAPAEKFVWNPAGEPYLIKRGDTLGVISNDKYGTPKKWKKLWENNKPLIKNPNLIFAGFTLYYVPDNKLAENL